MNDKQYFPPYTISWTQEYTNWPKSGVNVKPEQEEVLDLTEAQQVLAKIMAL